MPGHAHARPIKAMKVAVALQLLEAAQDAQLLTVQAEGCASRAAQS